MEKLLDYKKLERKLDGMIANLQESTLSEQERTELIAEIADVEELMGMLEDSSDYVKEYLQKKSEKKEEQQLLEADNSKDSNSTEESTDDTSDENQDSAESPIDLPAWMMGIWFVVFFCFIAFSIKGCKKDNNTDDENTSYIEDTTAIAPIVSATQTKQDVAQINSQLLFEVKSFEDIKVFLRYIKNIATAIESETDQKQKKNWTAKLKAMQKKNFPKARKFWHQRMKQEMWSQDVEVKMSGTTVSFIGGLFAANANKQAAYETVESQLKELRFKMVKFMFTEYSEYTYWTIDSPADGDI